MRKSVCLGILILLMVLVVMPVTSWHAITSKSGPEEVCTKCDSVPYTIDAASTLWDLSKLEITDTLPEHLVYGSVMSSSWPDYTVDTSQPGKVIITLYNVPKNTDIHISLLLIPDSSNPPVAGDTVVNTVSSRVTGCGDHFYENGQCVHPFSYWEGTRSPAINPEGSIMSVSTTFSDRFCPPSDPIPTPEFPVIAVPAALIVGMLGIVFFIRQTRE